MHRYALIAVALAACKGSVSAPAEVTPATVLLEQAPDKTLEACNASGVCQSVPNPDGCASLLVTIDTKTGAACAQCLAQSGTEIWKKCADAPIQCTVLTVPEPDCVVCAHENGAVVYSSCPAKPPDRCVRATNAVNQPCQICRDPAGRVIVDECHTDCANTVCPPLQCGDGTIAGRQPGDCCDSCWPVDHCAEVTCASVSVPSCPTGTILRRDPSDCCGWVCMPLECPAVPACSADTDCQSGVCVDGGCHPACPAGFVRKLPFPACGTCVLVPPQLTFCQVAGDCASGEDCVGVTSCLKPPCTDPTTCPAACVGGVCPCMGVCRPSATTCKTDFTPTTPCAGMWLSLGEDASGCPLPPSCVCPGGSISLDGKCGDLCGGISCPMPDPAAQVCPAGSHLDTTYPHCCGLCVVDDPCAAARTACQTMTCGAGSACQPLRTATGCTATCVPTEPRCVIDSDCPNGLVCSTKNGDCLSGCSPTSTMPCPAICYGRCIAEACRVDADCALGAHCDATAAICIPNTLRACTSAADCTAVEDCKQQCIPSPTCAGTACADVCVSVCRAKSCLATSDCPSGTECAGAFVCPPNTTCPTPDHPGECRVKSTLCGSTTSPMCMAPEICVNGACAKVECADSTKCGPRPLLPSILCPDGKTWSGPTGHCLKTPMATCAWEIAFCPP
jgi:hypothetical protein